MLLGDLAPALRWPLVALSVLIAGVSWRVVEQPFREGRELPRAPVRSLAVGAGTICLVVVVAQLVGLFGASSVAASSPVQRTAESTPQPARDTDLFGAASGPTNPPVETVNAAPAPAQSTPGPTLPPGPREIRPRLADARNDVDGLTERGCGLSLVGSKPPLCELGAVDGRVTVALVGDSHAAQWFPALDAIARERGWKILPFTKDSCIFLDMRIMSLHLEREYTECARWRDQVVAALQRLKPDLIVVSSSRWVHPVSRIDADGQRQVDAMARLLKALPSPVAIIADTPLPAHDVPACLSRRDRTADACGTTRSYALTGHLARDGRTAEAVGATLIDPADWLCGPEMCPAIIDWTIVYRDDHHLTATMARRLAPLLEQGLLDALPTPAHRPRLGEDAG
jgi:hypothetical protein